MKNSIKRLVGAVLIAAVCMPASFAADFTTVRVDNVDDFGAVSKRLRYADDKTPIPLSGYYWDGSVFATIPAENAGRPVEVFSTADYQPPSDDESDWYGMLDLAACGVLTGDSDGKFHPERTVTRAEAAAMLIRTLGVTQADGTDSGYTDVPASAWYASVVQTARECGIVSPDTRFRPEALVTREEFVVMAARAMAYAGLLDMDKAAPSAMELEDADVISSWAKSAYESFGSLIPVAILTEVQAPGADDPTYLGPYLYYAEPQKSATRLESAELIDACIRWLPVYPTAAAREAGLDEEMPIVDGSTSTLPITQAVYSALFTNGDRHPANPVTHSKSHASYERLINGEVDMLFASVYPASDILALAEEKGVELELIPIAHDAMIFFTNKDNPATGLTSEQISNIYVNNAYDNWNQLDGPDALLYPYCRNNDSGSHAQMERHFLHGAEIHETIRQETTSYAMQSILTDVIDAQTSDPTGYALGYSIYYYYWNANMVLGTADQLKLLEIDGVAPTDETIADGSYPLSNNTYVVLRKDTPEDTPARRLADFMLTEAGQRCVENAGYGPLQ